MIRKNAQGKYQLTLVGWLVAIPTAILLGNTRLGPLVVLSLISVLVYQFVKPLSSGSATTTAITV